MTTPRSPKFRSGFTLVELMVAITVIAILAGILAPALIGALRATREAAVVFEMKQLELAIEQFKNDYGFYPPTIGSNANFAIDSPDEMRAYLNRIAPQNAESSSRFPGSSNSRLEDWWINVGSKLDETSSLQFWLSGLCKNKQFPLTGGVNVDTSGGTTGVMTICGFGADQYSDGTPYPNGMVNQRNNYFEFKDNQLAPAFGGAVAKYQQSHGATEGDLSYRYLDYKSYNYGAYQDGAEPPIPPYINPKSFQLVTYGMDAESGMSRDANNPDARGADNLCNFTEGRLDKFVNQ